MLSNNTEMETSDIFLRAEMTCSALFYTSVPVKTPNWLVVVATIYSLEKDSILVPVWHAWRVQFSKGWCGRGRW